MAIDSAISGIGLLRVSPGLDDKARQDNLHQERKKKHPQDHSTTSYPVVNEQGQMMGWLIDVTA